MKSIQKVHIAALVAKTDVIKILENKSRLQVYVISLTFVPLGLNATAYSFHSFYLFRKYPKVRANFSTKTATKIFSVMLGKLNILLQNSN